MRNNTGIIQRKKFAILWCKAMKNLMDGSGDKIHQR